MVCVVCKDGQAAVPCTSVSEQLSILADKVQDALRRAMCSRQASVQHLLIGQVPGASLAAGGRGEPSASGIWTGLMYVQKRAG